MVFPRLCTAATDRKGVVAGYPELHRPFRAVNAACYTVAATIEGCFSAGTPFLLQRPALLAL